MNTLERLEKEIKQVYLIENEDIHELIEPALKKLAEQHIFIKQYLSSIIKDEIFIKQNIFYNQQYLVINDLLNTHTKNDYSINYDTSRCLNREKTDININVSFHLPQKECSYSVDFFIIFGKIINRHKQDINERRNYRIEAVKAFLAKEFDLFYKENKKDIDNTNIFMSNLFRMLEPLNKNFFNFNTIFNVNEKYSKKDIYNKFLSSKEIIILNTDIDISQNLDYIKPSDLLKNTIK